MALEVLLFTLVALAFPVLLAVLTVRQAQDMEAVVIRERITGRVTNLCVGPRWYIRLPFVDEVQILDLHHRRSVFEGLTVQTCEGLSASMTVMVGWQQQPGLLRALSLRQVQQELPLTQEIVNRWIVFTVRDWVSRYSLPTIQNLMRRPHVFRALVLADLQRRVAPLGVEVQDLELICLPAPAVVAARVAAEARRQELQTIAEARAIEVQMLSQALDGGTANDHVVKLLAIDALRGGDARALASLDLDWDRGTPPAGNRSMPIRFIVGP